MEWFRSFKTVFLMFALNVTAISLRVTGNESCAQPCTESTSDRSTICVSRSGCTFTFPGKTLKCLGNTCHLTLKYDFSHVYRDNAVTGYTESKEVAVSTSAGIVNVTIDNLLFAFTEERKHELQSGETESEIGILVYIINSSPLNSGRYEIEIYDNHRFKTIYGQTYQCRIVHSPSGHPECKSDFMQNTDPASFAYVLTCSIQEGFPPIEVNISSKPDCPFLESRSSNTTWKTVTFFVPSCLDKGFTCSASSMKVQTPIPYGPYSGNCTFDLSEVKIQTQMTNAGSNDFFNDASDIILLVVIASLVFMIICGLIFLTGYIKKTRSRNPNVDLDGMPNTFDDFDTDFPPEIKREINDGQAYGNV